MCHVFSLGSVKSDSLNLDNFLVILISLLCVLVINHFAGHKDN